MKRLLAIITILLAATSYTPFVPFVPFVLFAPFVLYTPFAHNAILEQLLQPRRYLRASPSTTKLSSSNSVTTGSASGNWKRFAISQ